MTQGYKKKLIEVAIPLAAINTASSREKSIRHGHPSTLHLWWSRKPLATCRAVLFAQLVDDPSGYTEELLKEPKIRKQAEEALPVRIKAWENRKADAKGNIANTPEPTLADCAAEIERKRLFKIIEELVLWENSTNEEVLERARAEIRRSCGGELPPVYDPFSGGGSIPLEAQRLGLPAYGSDLNPVAVMIGKAMIEIPPKYKDMAPTHPGLKARNHYRNAEGLAEDVKYYGEWIRQKAWERIGHLYPEINLPKEHGGGKATVIAWIWGRTVRSPDPAFADVQVPVVSSFVLSSKKGSGAWIEPIVNRQTRSITYRVKTNGSKEAIEAAQSGTKAGRGSNFTCLISGSAITMQHLKSEAKFNGLGQVLLGLVVERGRSKLFIDPPGAHTSIAAQASPSWKPETPISDDRRAFTPPDYGMLTFGDLFTNRQLVALNTFSELVAEVRTQIQTTAKTSKLRPCNVALADGGAGAKAYAEAISVYLAFGVSRASDFWNTGALWERSGGFIAHLFNMQAIPIVWEFAEGNPFSSGTGTEPPMMRSAMPTRLARFGRRISVPPAKPCAGCAGTSFRQARCPAG